MNAVIKGIGAALPKKCIKNSDLPESLDTSDEWITTRTGIKQRYIVESETTASLATEASKNALDHAGILANEIDLIIVGTVTGDYTFPSVATFVQKNLGIKSATAFDVNAACCGFLYALDIANSFIKSGKSKCAIVIGSDTFSKILDWRDRSSCVLFGDGAGAVVLQARDVSNKGIVYCQTYADGAFTDYLMTTGGISTTQNAGFVKMLGREVFKFSVEKFYESLMKLLEDNGMSLANVDLLVPHQANCRIIKALIEKSGIDENKVLLTIDKHSNTSAGTIPLALNEVKNKIFSMENVVLLSMGAGFTWGSALIKF
ncbi:MAG: ketoacyl-ACP synthase III [Holosporaceae bacterium]|jgi:3-oxoacyl-[acyl-carrier-protein] synthase-3|nr:ketoacyl-ACP synthase III [Holosporaceae bacterium]